MLRYRLPRHAQLVLHRQAAAELEECLSVPVRQLVKNRPPRRVCQGLEDVGHRHTIGKWMLACQIEGRLLVRTGRRWVPAPLLSGLSTPQTPTGMRLAV